MELRQRKRNRLQDYKYNRAGYYFITICTRQRENFFWEPERTHFVGADIIRPPPQVLSPYGYTVERAILDIPQHYPGVTVEKYVVMPNHVHLILGLPVSGGRIISAPTKSISTIIGQMKRFVSKETGVPLWQKGFHDHIIRGEADYLRIWEYIDANPAKWREDCYYSEQPAAL